MVVLIFICVPVARFHAVHLGGADGSPIMVGLKVATSDKKPFPSGVRIEYGYFLASKCGRHPNSGTR
jgi:hypothetical protein